MAFTAVTGMPQAPNCGTVKSPCPPADSSLLLSRRPSIIDPIVIKEKGSCPTSLLIRNVLNTEQAPRYGWVGRLVWKEMGTMASDEPVAIFVDTENLTQWVKSGQLSALMKELGTRGRVEIRRAYARWSHPSVTSYQATLNQLGFELINSFHPVSGKNSADMQMAVDVMQYATRDDLRCIALATGDSDFSPLFRRLREMGKEVIGVGPCSALSQVVENSCSRFIYTDTKKKTPAGSSRQSGKALSLKAATSLLKATLKALDGPVNASELKNRMVASNTAFNEKQLGFKRFCDFVRAIPGVALKEEASRWCVSLDITEAKATSARTVPAPQGIVNVEVCAPADMYRQVLRRKHWHLPPCGSFRQIVTALSDASARPMPRTEICTQIAQLCDGTITTSDVRHAVELFYKIGISQYAGKNEEGKSLWHVTPVSVDEAIRAADTGMLVRLFSGLKEDALPFEAAHVTPLLLDRYDEKELAILLDNARVDATDSALDVDSKVHSPR